MNDMICIVKSKYRYDRYIAIRYRALILSGLYMYNTRVALNGRAVLATHDACIIVIFPAGNDINLKPD